MPDIPNPVNDALPLCGNCQFFVVGGRCKLVSGPINPKAVCDLHKFGNPLPIDTKTNPRYKKSDVHYKPGFFAETTTGDIAQKAIQMEHELLSRGIPEEEVHRAVIAYFSQPEPPSAMPWPGPVTGLDLAGRIDPYIAPDTTGVPLTNFRGLPENVEPYPTPNKSPYGIGTTSQPYPSFYSPSPNLDSMSNSFEIRNKPYPYDSAVWTGLASDVNSEPSMHGEHGYNVATTIPLFPDSYEALHSDSRINSRVIPPSGAITEAKKDTKKKYLELLAKWALLLGGVIGINAIIKKYIDSGTDKPLEIIAEYEYHGHVRDDECAKYSKKRFNLLETHNRPVVPSEKLGYTTTHPNCICTWKVMQDPNIAVNKVTKNEQAEITTIEDHIKQAAKKGKLHKVDQDGKLSTKTTKKNPLKELCSCMNVTLPSFRLDLPVFKKTKGDRIKRLPRKALQEAIANLRSEFKWLTDDYVNSAKKLAEDAGGELYLVRAATESITNHMGEGEPYRRKLSAEELNSMTRTGIGKSMDINHQPEFETDATILDAEFDKNRKEIQMLVVERDPQINQAINDRKITAVSINGGMPRSESIEPCDHECTDNCELCLVPKGVVLGELDNIGMTWVVTDPNGLYWNGHFVPSAEPGIKITKIETL